jgi:FkbM family methyltransferase
VAKDQQGGSQARRSGWETSPKSHGMGRTIGTWDQRIEKWNFIRKLFFKKYDAIKVIRQYSLRVSLKRALVRLYHVHVFISASLIMGLINILDLPRNILSKNLLRSGGLLHFKDIRYRVVKNSTRTSFLGQYFVTQTALEENRVVERFKIETDLIEYLNEELDFNSVFWDIGACVGNFSLFAANRAKEVLSFEPDGLTYSSLLENIYNSGLENITAYPVALGNVNTLSNLYMKNFRIANAYNSVGREVDFAGKLYKSEFSQKCIQLRADTLLIDYSVTPPTHLKIDVDGNELQVLEGFGEILKSDKLKFVIVELDFDNKESLSSVQLLKNCGFLQQDNQFRPESSNRVFRKI